MADTLRKRLRLAMDEEGVAPLARRIGISRQALYALAGGAWPEQKTLAKLKRAGLAERDAV